jgi:N-acyl-D-amino-acid deacylase
VKVHISHLKGWNEAEVQEVLALLDAARRDVDLSFDVYPYQRGSTMLNYLLPYEVWQDGPLGVLAKLDCPEIRARFRAGLDALAVPLDQITIAWCGAAAGDSLQGMNLTNFVSDYGRPIEEALVELLIDSNLSTLMVVGPYDKDHLVEPLVQHDLAILGSDGIYFPGGHVHPRVFGSAGRWLGPMVRDRRLHSLEAAVHKASGKSAARYGLADRGVIRTGAFADLIVFDERTIEDRATYEKPQQDCVGMEHVIVNGETVVDGSQPVTGPLPGRRVNRDRSGTLSSRR